MKWQRIEDPIQVVQFRFGYFPRVFRWRGCYYRVEGIEECWAMSRLGWRGRVARHGFYLKCAAGTFDVYQDLIANTWHLRRARLDRQAEGSARLNRTYALDGNACIDESHVGGVFVGGQGYAADWGTSSDVP